MKKQTALIIMSALLILRGCTCYQESKLNRTDTSVKALPILQATDGKRINEILVSWESIKDTEYFILYRSRRPDTSFCKIATVRMSDRGRMINPDIEVLHPDETGASNQNTGDNQHSAELKPAEFISDINLNTTNMLGYRGKFVSAGQTCNIDITVSTLVFTVVFPGGTWGRYYDRDDVVEAINSAAGEIICVQYEDNFIKITAPDAEGPIIISNSNDPISYNPVTYFLKSGTAQDETITIEPAEIQDEDEENADSTDSTETDENHRDELSPSCFYVLDKNIITAKTYYYMMKAYSSRGKLTAESITDSGYATSSTAPCAPENVVASKGQGQDVTITWGPVQNAEYYRVYRYRVQRLDLTGMFSPITEKVTETSYVDRIGNRLLPGMYLYLVTSFNSDNEQSMYSTADYGFRSISNHEFILEYDTVIESSFTKFTLLHKNGLGAIGSEKIYANVMINNAIGTGYYKSSGSISGADVNITYTNYCDHYLTINGTLVTDIGYPAWDKNGDQTGRVNVSGIYSGYVEYHLDIKNGEAGGGYYTVCQTGQNPENLDWTVLDSN